MTWRAALVCGLLAGCAAAPLAEWHPCTLVAEAPSGDLATLNATAASAFAESGIDLVVSGRSVYRCGCGERALAGDSGSRDLAGDQGSRDLAGDAGSRELAGDAGTRDLAGEAGTRDLAGDAGKRELAGDAGTRDLAGEAGSRELAGDAGSRELAGDAGSRDLAGEAGSRDLAGDTGSRDLAGDAGKRDLAGGTEVRCRIDRACLPFRVSGFTRAQIFDGSQLRPLPATCQRLAPVLRRHP